MFDVRMLDVQVLRGLSFSSMRWSPHTPSTPRYLRDVHGRAIEPIVAEMKGIVHFCLAAIRAKIEVDESLAGFSSFQLFGFDFMLDANFKVWLIEVNASPATAA